MLLKAPQTVSLREERKPLFLHIYRPAMTALLLRDVAGHASSRIFGHAHISTESWPI